MVELYPMMFKRKSFRRFKGECAISDLELERIANFINHTAERLFEDIPLTYKIVPFTQTSCKRGEYGILIFSNMDNRSLINIGFMFSQLDFYLASVDIGTCWYGMGVFVNQKMVHFSLFNQSKNGPVNHIRTQISKIRISIKKSIDPEMRLVFDS